MRYLTTALIGISALMLFFLSTSPSFGQCSTVGTLKVVGGLISAPNLSGSITSSTGDCVTGTNQAAILSTNIPNYDDLESLYYTQAKTIDLNGNTILIRNNKVIGSGSNTAITSNIANPYPTLSLYSGDLTIGPGAISNPSGAQTQVIFVEGNMYIQNNIVYDTSDQNHGLVFVVKGDVLINDPAVPASPTQIDAVIISSGTICSAYTGTCPTTLTARGSSPLIVNGSLISLNASKQPIFRRNLNDNSVPAEQANQQPKYLVILRNIMSQTLQITTEGTNYGPGN